MRSNCFNEITIISFLAVAVDNQIFVLSPDSNCPLIDRRMTAYWVRWNGWLSSISTAYNMIPSFRFPSVGRSGGRRQRLHRRAGECRKRVRMPNWHRRSRGWLCRQYPWSRTAASSLQGRPPSVKLSLRSVGWFLLCRLWTLRGTRYVIGLALPPGRWVSDEQEPSPGRPNCPKSSAAAARHPAIPQLFATEWRRFHRPDRATTWWLPVGSTNTHTSILIKRNTNDNNIEILHQILAIAKMAAGRSRIMIAPWSILKDGWKTYHFGFLSSEETEREHTNRQQKINNKSFFSLATAAGGRRAALSRQRYIPNKTGFDHAVLIIRNNLSPLVRLFIFLLLLDRESYLWWPTHAAVGDTTINNDVDG